MDVITRLEVLVMFHNENRTQIAGVLGMSGAVFFFVGLLVEYHYGLFPPGSGTLYVINQIMFLVAMVCICGMLWQMRGMNVGGNGRFARITLTIFSIGWAMLIVATLVSLLTGNPDNLLFPLGGLSNLLFGLLAGIAVARNKNWPGWGRFALLLQALYYLLVMMVLPLVLTGSVEPTLLTESLWMAIWFLVGLALWQESRRQMAGLAAPGSSTS
jgi:hypothetical protein